MDPDQETPCTKWLREMPYSELRKVASEHGIKQRMKSEKLIAAIMSRNFDDDKSFSTPAAKELNSSRKNKEEKFDEIQMSPLVTPRRGTYSVESPISVKVNDISPAPVLEDSSVLELSNVTMSRGSERKLRPRKVSFISPMIMPRTPKNLNLKNRPKTPVASRTPINKRVSFTTPSGQQKRKSPEKSLLTTPQSNIVKFDADCDIKSLSSNLHVVENEDWSEKDGKCNSDVLGSKAVPSAKKGRGSAKIKQSRNSDSDVLRSTAVPSAKKGPESAKIKRSNTPGNKIKRSNTPGNKIKRSDTPGSKIKRSDTPGSKIKRSDTPDFRRIHQKAFDKMESIDDYEKRKILNSAKKLGQCFNLKSRVTKARSKIPSFSGIPFIPSVKNTIPMKRNSKMKNLVTSVGKPKPVSENIQKLPRQDKSKFDLKASLSRKLGYKPYRGPLKPLSESNKLNTSTFHPAKESAVNKVVKENRSQTRSMLRGVRTNKRFDLQMRNRKLGNEA